MPRLDVNLLIVLLWLLRLWLRLGLGLWLGVLGRELDHGDWASRVVVVVLRGRGVVVLLTSSVVQRGPGLRLLLRLISPVLWWLLLGIMLLLLLLLIVPMVVAGDARLLDRRCLVAPGLFLAVAGGHHALLRDSLGHGNRGRSLGSSVHRAGRAGVGHHSESPVSSPD